MCIKQALLVKALLNIAIRKRVYISYQRGRQCCSFNSVGQCEGLRTWNGQQEDSTLLFFRNNKVCSLLNAKLRSVGTDKNYIMRSSNFKWHILTVVLLVFSAFTVLAEDALITKQITLNIKAGGLQSEIEGSEWQWNQITNLKLVGELNINDVQFIRQMAGCYYNENGDKYDGHLQHLDIADVEFVGDGSFKAYNGEFYDTAKFESSRVGDYLFSYLDGLQTVVLPSCVVSIYDYAFYQCGGLVSVVMPDGLFSIGSHTFQGCRELSSLILPKKLGQISDHAFWGCNKISSVELPSSLMSIDATAFSSCEGLTSVKVDEANPYYSSEETVLYNKDKSRLYAAWGNIKDYVVPSSVSSIENNAFYYNSSLTSLSASSNLISIGKEAFYDCVNLASIELPEVTIIGTSAFAGCSKLTSFTFPKNLTTIGYAAFYGCSGLTTLSLPSNLTKIGMNAFRKCNGLTSIYANMTTPAEIDQCAFDENIKANATLYVPNGTYQTYAVANCWRDFLKIKEFDSTGVESVFSTSDVKELSRYTVNGQRLKEPTRGLNIVKYSDGSSRKEIVK